MYLEIYLKIYSNQEDFKRGNIKTKKSLRDFGNIS